MYLYRLFYVNVCEIGHSFLFCTCYLHKVKSYGMSYKNNYFKSVLHEILYPKLLVSYVTSRSSGDLINGT